MQIHFKPMAMDVVGGGKVVRIKSGGVITLLLMLTLSVVCFQNYVNHVVSRDERLTKAMMSDLQKRLSKKATVITANKANDGKNKK